MELHGFTGLYVLRLGGVLRMGLSTIVHVLYGAQRDTPQSHLPTCGLKNTFFKERISPKPCKIWFIYFLNSTPKGWGRCFCHGNHCFSTIPMYMFTF